MSKNTQLKAGVWYTLCYFITKGLAFLVTPIFARLMSETDYGVFSSFNAWRSILVIIFSMSVATSINRARFDYEGKIKEYISTIATQSVGMSLIGYVIVLLNIGFFEKLFNMPAICIHISFFDIIFAHVLEIYLMKQRIEYKYKTAAFFTVLNAASSLLVSLALVLVMEDKFMGRVIGQALPAAIIGIGLYVYIMATGKKVSKDMLKYAFVVSIPIVPHQLSEIIMTQSDRIIIMELLDETVTAYYSIACSCSMTVHLFLASINLAWLPWLGEKMHAKDFGLIKKRTNECVVLFFAIYLGVLLISPEFLRVYGGSKYEPAIWAIPPLLLVNVFQFLNMQYVNILQFEKKNWYVAMATVICATVNVGLNYLLIPRYGYVIAAYTTVCAHMLMCLINYLSVWKLGYKKAYSHLFFIAIAIVSMFLCAFAHKLYEISVIRYVLLGAYVLCLGGAVYKYRDVLKSIIKKRA